MIVVPSTAAADNAVAVAAARHRLQLVVRQLALSGRGMEVGFGDFDPVLFRQGDDVGYQRSLSSPSIIMECSMLIPAISSTLCRTFSSGRVR